MFSTTNNLVINQVAKDSFSCSETVGSKSTCPKWHFGQVGHGDKKTIGIKKTKIFCSV
jgi:hypothetical protein